MAKQFLMIFLIYIIPSIRSVPPQATSTISPSETSKPVQLVPPQPWDVARMARYILHNSDWVSIATISTQDSIKGYPFVSLKSVSDGPVSNGTGVPYLYMTDMDVSGKDILEDRRCTIMASLAESDYCKQEDFDPQDPRCAKLLITGRLSKVDNTTAEYTFGLNSLYERHPSMKWWPKDHQFYVAKVSIEQICVLDYFGGIKYVTVDDYFNANEVRHHRHRSYIVKNEVISIITVDED